MSRLDYKFKEILFDPAAMDSLFPAPATNGEEEQRKQERENSVHARMRDVRRAMVANLTPRQRECLTLYYIQGYDQWQIAQFLGIHQTTVSQHIRYALKKLRSVLRAKVSKKPCTCHFP